MERDCLHNEELLAIKWCLLIRCDIYAVKMEMLGNDDKVIKNIEN